MLVGTALNLLICISELGIGDGHAADLEELAKASGIINTWLEYAFSFKIRQNRCCSIRFHAYDYNHISLWMNVQEIYIKLLHYCSALQKPLGAA